VVILNLRSCHLDCKGSTHLPESYELHIGSIVKEVCSSVFDDILVYSRSLEDHVHHLGQMLQLLREE
jgi:hypothetical protein